MQRRGRVYVDLNFNEYRPEFDYVENTALQRLHVFGIEDDEEFEQKVVSDLQVLRASREVGSAFQGMVWGTVLKIYRVESSAKIKQESTAPRAAPVLTDVADPNLLN